MAVDELLAQQAADLGQAVLRFYGWLPATLSLGYFQRYADRQQHAASGQLDCVRRASGGGAIVHDHELTYSLAVPHAHPLGSDARQLYDLAHQTLIDLLGGSLPAGSPRLFQWPATERAKQAEPFLCFARRAEGDVVLGDFKICGSAQRRRRGAIVQHGSVLLKASAAAPELPGINDIAGTAWTAEQLAAAWRPRLLERLQAVAIEEPLSAEEQATAGKLVVAQFGNDSWTRKR